MTAKDILTIIGGLPSTITDIGVLIIILSLVEISPIKLNPWKWLKSFAALPSRLEKLEREFNDDRAFRWRSMIINRADRVQDGHKLRREVWKDTIDTITNYEKYCTAHPDFRNEFATMTIEYMRHKYLEAKENNSFIE